MGHRTRRIYAIAAVLCLVVVGAGTYLYLSEDQTAPTPSQAAESARPAAAARQAALADEPPVLSTLMTDQAREFVGEARRLATAGDFAGAETALKKAEEVAPGWDETAEARREIAELNTPEGQLAARLERARSAVERGDNAVAEQAITEAERLNAPVPVIAELRTRLQAAEQEDARKDDHIASLLAEMRTAAARHDFATANRALNEAARIDIRNRDVLQARDELSKEQDSVRPPVRN